MSQAEPVLLVRREAGVAWLTLNRPDAGNAIDMALATALRDVALELEQDATVRCVVITGAGKVFCAGGDVPSFAAAPEGPGAYLHKLAGTFHEAAVVLARMPKPVVTAINGAAAGAGMSLAIGADIALAGQKASFLPAYGAIGLTPDGGMTWSLPRLVGLRHAQEIILTNRRVGADDALGLGMVNRVVEDGALLAEAAVLAERLAGGAVGAAAKVRSLLASSFETALPAQLDRELEGISAAAAGAEGREGVAAYLEKRAPNFRDA